jgi:hypothetical protein
MLAADGRVGEASIGDVARESSTLRRALPRRALIAVLLALALSAALLDVLGSGRAAPVAHRASIAAQQSLLKLPLSARAPVSSTLGAEDPAYAVRRTGSRLTASNSAERLSSSFTDAGASISSDGANVGLSLRGVSYGATTTPLGAVTPHVDRNRVLYSKAGISEWYANGPLGLEQGFTVAEAPSGRAAGTVTLSLAVSGDALPRLASDRQSISFMRSGKTAFSYSGLSVTDASGRTLPGSLALAGRTLSIRIDSASARFPLHVDPLIASGGRLAFTGASGSGRFGASVAVSSDGSEVLVGAPSDNKLKGAVWAFARSGSTWTQQGAKITPLPAERETGFLGEFKEGEFGSSVAISGNGEYAVIGAVNDLEEEGAAWFFHRSGSTWSQMGRKVWPERGTIGSEGEEPESEESRFGAAVAISSDGTEALIGAPADEGTVFTFKRSGSKWSEEHELSPNDELGPGAEFAASLGISESGTTALIGGPNDGVVKAGAQIPGAAWVYTHSGSTWTQGPKLTGSEELGEAPRFGESVALSADAASALIGGPGDSAGVGAAWAFDQSGGVWAQSGSKLTASDESGAGRFGASLLLSADGDTALIGSPNEASSTGAARVFTRSGEAWSQAQTLLATGEAAKGQFGFSLALSDDGRTAAIGAPGDSGGGAVRIFVSGLPSTVTGAASSVTKTSVTLNATVNPNGSEVTGCQFEYGTTTSYGSAVPCSSLPGSGTSPVAIAATLEGLTPATPYHFRISATNANGTNVGEDATFTTVPNAPSVVTGAASQVTSNSATLNGSVDPNGGTVGECKFEYGTSTTYEASTPCATAPGSGTSPVAVSASVSGLTAHSAYHYRLVASNAGGTGEGSDQSFTPLSGAPEFGTCVKVAVGTGAYGDAGCTKASGKNDYEWNSAGASGVKFALSQTGGAVKLTTADKNDTIECSGLSGEGEYTSSKTVHATLTLSGCALQHGGSCSAAIATAPLEGVLGVEAAGTSAAKNKLALDLAPVGGSGPFAEFTCGSQTVALRGSVIVPLKSNKMLASSTLTFKASKQKQRPESLEGSVDVLEESFAGGAFEQVGLAAKSLMQPTQPIEANSVA